MTLLENKKAHLKYAVRETFSAGIELLGQEVKALRLKQGSLEGSRVVVRGGEAWLIGMTIPPFQQKNAPKDYDVERSRRLLVTKKELHDFGSAEDTKGLTIIPLEVYTLRGLVKIRVAVVQGKKKVDRREDLKRRDANREQERLLKSP